MLISNIIHDPGNLGGGERGTGTASGGNGAQGGNAYLDYAFIARFMA